MKNYWSRAQIKTGQACKNNINMGTRREEKTKKAKGDVEDDRKRKETT
jgi:hypothetical protein